jgi:hypothetical protein
MEAPMLDKVTPDEGSFIGSCCLTGLKNGALCSPRKGTARPLAFVSTEMGFELLSVEKPLNEWNFYRHTKRGLIIVLHHCSLACHSLPPANGNRGM